MRSMFISSDAQLPAAAFIHDINKLIAKGIEDSINISDFTNTLDSIGIIVKCFDEKWKSMGHGKERKYISYKNRYADIRLNVSYADFMSANKLERFYMIKNLIISAVKIIDQKINKKEGCYFDGQGLIDCIELKLSEVSNDYYFH